MRSARAGMQVRWCVLGDVHKETVVVAIWCLVHRIAHAPAQYVTDSSFVEQRGNQRGRKATEASTSAWADLWRDVCSEIDAWRGLGDTLLVRKVIAHTTLEAVLAGVITADDRAGNDLADAACKLVFWNTVPRRKSPGGEASSHLGRHTHGSLDCARWFCETAFER